MPPSPQVIVLGSINTDLVSRVPVLPAPGVTVIGRNFFQASGGKGANQAVAAARAGLLPIVFIAAVGDDDFGRWLLGGLSRELLILENVQRIDGCPSGIALILVDDRGENCIAVTPGANGRLMPEHVERVPEDVFRSARVFLASLEVPLSTVQCGLARAKRAGLTTILNPAPVSDREAIVALLPLVDVLTPNEHEAAQLLNRQFRGLQQSLAAAEELRGLGCATVLITMGAEGVAVARTEGTSSTAAFNVAVVDTTAAGDAFSGALATALAEGQALADAVRFASAGGALSVTHPGAQPSLPTRLAIEEFLQRQVP